MAASPSLLSPGAPLCSEKTKTPRHQKPGQALGGDRASQAERVTVKPPGGYRTAPRPRRRPFVRSSHGLSGPTTGSARGRPAPLPRAPEVIWGGCCRAAGRRVGLPRAERRSPPPPPPRPPPPSRLLPLPARNSEHSAERGLIGAAEAREPAGRAARGAGERPPAGEAGPRRGCVRRARPATAVIARPSSRPGSNPFAPRERAAPPEGHLHHAGASQGRTRAVPATWGRRSRSPCAALHPVLPRFQSTPCRYGAAALQASPPGFGAN